MLPSPAMWFANALSLVRIPLGGAFLLLAGDRALAFVLVALAALSDMLDGWAARRAMARMGPDKLTAPHSGDWLDPLCDKLFAGAVATGFFLIYGTPLPLLALLLTREILQVFGFLLYRTGRNLGRVESFNYRAGRVGKATTVVQFGTALVILAGWQAPWPLAVLAAVLGLWSVVIYAGRVRVHHAAQQAPG